MKTRKLLLLVAGFMLFAFTAKAQYDDYSISLKNSNTLGIPIDYLITGKGYESPIASPYNFSHSGTLNSGESWSKEKRLWTMGDVEVTISAAGYSQKIPLLYLIQNGDIEYEVLPGYIAVLQCETYRTHYNLEFKIIRRP